MRQRLPVVVSTVALVVAVLGWTPVGESARNLVIPKGSVGTPQLKAGAVTTPKLRNGAVGTVKLKTGAVTSLKVRNGSLLAEDFKAGQLPAGQKGDKGDPGPAGPAGLSQVQVVSADSATNSSPSREVNVSCPGGKTLIGGGAAVTESSNLALQSSRPAIVANGWRASALEVNATAASWRVSAWAICATVP